MDTGAGRILTPKSNEEVMREAEVLALRSMGDNLAAIAQEMGANREVLVKMREDMAVIKERQRVQAEFNEGLPALEARIEAIEQRNAQQDGAVKFGTFLKDFGPWLVTLIVAAWAFLTGRVT